MLLNTIQTMSFIYKNKLLRALSIHIQMFPNEKLCLSIQVSSLQGISFLKCEKKKEKEKEVKIRQV